MRQTDEVQGDRWYSGRSVGVILMRSNKIRLSRFLPPSVPVSPPAVNRYVDRIRTGQTPPAIKVDGNIIVDGNHRYAAGVLTGKAPATTPGVASPTQIRNAKPFGEIKVDPKDWGNH